MCLQQMVRQPQTGIEAARPDRPQAQPRRAEGKRRAPEDWAKAQGKAQPEDRGQRLYQRAAVRAGANLAHTASPPDLARLSPRLRGPQVRKDELAAAGYTLEPAPDGFAPNDYVQCPNCDHVVDQPDRDAAVTARTCRSCRSVVVAVTERGKTFSFCSATQRLGPWRPAAACDAADKQVSA